MTRDDLHLEVALLVSLLLHVMCFGGWRYRATLEQLPIFRPLARLIADVNAPAKMTAKKTVPPIPTITFVPVAESQVPRTPPQVKPELPRTFMETDDRQVTGAKPVNPQFYSDRNTVAANPENPTGKLGKTPYLDGKETRLMSTENVVPGPPARPAPAVKPPPPPVMRPSAPAVAPVPPPKPVAPAVAKPELPAKPVKPATEPGDTTVLKTVEGPKKIAAEGLKYAEQRKVALAPREVVTPPAPVVIPAAPVPVAPVVAPTPAPAMPVVPESLPSVGGGGSRRELASVKSRLTASGVRIGVAAFDVADSPFGKYDKEVIRAVQSHWYALIEQNRLYERAGVVHLRFDMLADGSVKNLEVKENSAGQILGLFCEKAIVDSAPFRPLPDQLRVLIGNEPRDVNFSFYY